MSKRAPRNPPVGLTGSPKNSGPLMTIEEVAEYLRCSVRHVHNLKRRGYLKFFKHGGKMLRFHRSSVERYIEERSGTV
jgi:excisionase family DNA binding protein